MTDKCRQATWLSRIADSILPRACPCCGRALAVTDTGICLPCLLRLPRNDLRIDSPGLEQMLGSTGIPKGPLRSWFRYTHTDNSSKIIRTAKYADRPDLARCMGRLFGSELAAAGVGPDAPSPSAIDLLLPVPLHWTKWLRRGYNQSAEICRGIAEALQCDTGKALVATRAHATQTHRDRNQRRMNVAGRFTIDNPSQLEGRHIAIVDDVITTGATMAECAAEIRRCGANPASLGILSIGLTL